MGLEWKHLAGARLWVVSLLLLAACFSNYRPWTQPTALQGVPIVSEAVRVADNLYRSGEFANPFGTLPTGYTALVPPGYPILVSGLFKLFGEGRGGWIVLSCLPVLALGLQMALLPWFSRILGYNPWTGVLAALFALLTKPLSYEQWEAHEAGLLTLVLAAAVCYWSKHSYTAGAAWMTGGLAGLTICFQPVIAPVYLGWMVLTAGRAILRNRRTIPLWAVPVLLCAPWMVRNELRLGTMWIRDGLGIELNVSFNDCAPFGFEQSQRQACFGRFHPNQNLEEALAVRRLGEAAYNRERMRNAFEWIVAHPGRAARLVAGRTWLFWFPSIDRWPEYLRNRQQSLIFWALTLATLGGVRLSLKHRTPGALVVGTLLALFPLVYYIVQFDPRYRYPILWVTWLEAAYFCAFLWERATAGAAVRLEIGWSARWRGMPQSVWARWPAWREPALLLLFGAIYSMAYLGLSSRWWFEDDPFVFDYAGRIHNPAGIFINPEVVRHFTAARALVPMQVFSYWIDMHVAGISPHFAYAHQAGSFLLTLLLLYFVLLRVLRNDKLAALSICVVWALLPATASVLQFLSTRHYLEGLMFSLLSVFLLQRLREEDGHLRWTGRLAVLLAAAVALLYKEIYVPVTPAVLLAYAWRYRDRALALWTGGLVCAYVPYRFWVVGPGVDYGMPYLNALQYLKFFTKLPYTIASNYGGYWICAIILGLGFYFVRQRRRGYRTLLFFFALLLVSIATVLPVSSSLYGTIRRPDPWYRIVFLVHTIAICGGGYLAVRSATRRVQLALAGIAFAALLPGVEKTRRLWVEMTASAEREAKFYLSNPDKVLLSDQEAYWFIPGVTSMYDVRTPHYLLVKDLPTIRVKPEVPLWRFRDGQFVPDLIRDRLLHRHQLPSLPGRLALGGRPHPPPRAHSRGLGMDRWA
ncbi:MAG TPA: hypothetical protein VN841_26315 [Bryobacteraceae bacterium]|nr:hypothetical protein [Bryobacteraceae bacterium]